jgi:hypothetical protein
MSQNSSTKTPDAPSAKPADNKPADNKPEAKTFDRFHPEMPKIPGVSPGSRQVARRSSSIDRQGLLQIGGLAAAVVLIGAVSLLLIKSRSPRAVKSSPVSDVTDQAVTAPSLPNPVAAIREGPVVAATVDELSKPWAAKKFTFVKPLSRENIDAMVIRLPGGELWAFSLQGPFGRCELEYVSDLARLASQFRFNASHPMVVSPCDGTIYDPLKVGPLGSNTWARGEIVQGSSLRPPISIDVKVSGRSIVADSIE